MSTKKSNYIIIPNEVFKDSVKNKSRILSVDELYLYSWMYRRRIPDGWFVEISIDNINNICYKFANGDESRNKRTIKQMLLNLKEKEYVTAIGDFDIHEKMKNSDTIVIEFPQIDITLGYNDNITYKIFDQFDSPLEFYIYAYIDCYGDGGRSISYYKWSKLVKKSETTVKETISRMNTYKFNPRIWKFSGDYFESKGKVMQQENTYYTRPDEDTIKQWNGYYAKDQSERNPVFSFKGHKKEKVWGDVF